MGCENCPPYCVTASFGLDSFKGTSDGSWEDNFGAVMGINSAMPVPGLSEYGIGWQLGMSYGVYDLDGWGEGGDVSSPTCQQQTFVTTGFFHKANCNQHLSFGVVYDWMINTEWGEYGTHPTLGQWRGQVEYAVSCNNAFGFWGCVRDREAVQTFQYAGQTLPTIGTITNRGVSQVNLFWHHKFCQGADSYLYVGVPQQDRLDGDGSLGCLTLGASAQVPLTDRLALYVNGSYLRPSSAAGGSAAVDQGYDVSIGVKWYFGGHAATHAINGGCWQPYMPVGNNSNFLVDQTHPVL
jgi:hypothetical protein